MQGDGTMEENRRRWQHRGMGERSTPKQGGPGERSAPGQGGTGERSAPEQGGLGERSAPSVRGRGNLQWPLAIYAPMGVMGIGGNTEEIRREPPPPLVSGCKGTTKAPN